MGLKFPNRILTRSPYLATNARRLGHLHAGHVLHLLALLIAGIWAALVPLLLLLGSLRQDLATFLCKTIDTQGVTKRPYDSFRRRWICWVISSQRRWRSRCTTC